MMVTDLGVIDYRNWEKSMKVLVTRSEKFIGSHLTVKLVKKEGVYVLQFGQQLGLA